MRGIAATEPFPEYLPQQPPAEAGITVDRALSIGELNPLFIGYNIEDLSYEIFPGLYAQMLYGESFEDEPDVELPAGWEAHLEPVNSDTPKDPALLRKWRGAWYFEDGVVTLAGSRQRRIFTSRPQMTDGTVECDVLQPATERNYWGPGLLVCWKPGAFYYVYLCPERGLAVLAKGSNQRYVQGAKTVAEKRMPLVYDRWYRIAVTVKQGRVRMAVDGDIVLEWQDPAPLTGGVGLESSFAVCRFRNLVVTPERAEPWRADFSMKDRPYTHTANISRWWDPVVTGTAQARYKWEKENPYNTDRCQMVQLVSGAGTAGVHNTGLHNWGLTFRQGWNYQGRLYLRGDYTGEVTLALQSRDGARTYATQKLSGIRPDWKRFDIHLQSTRTDRNARFAVWIDRPGTLFVDQVILMPGSEGLYKGLPVRKDLAAKMLAGVGHVRFGGDMINTWGFDWKEMTKPQDKRRQYLDGWNYHKSAQFMIFEFLDLCRAAGVEPILNLGEHLPPEELADFVEYCNGGAGTKWGKKRIENGRNEPYGIRYLMYGNGLPEPERVERLLEMLDKVDPTVRLIIGDVGHVPWVMITRREPAVAVRVNRFAGRLEAMSSRPEVGVLGSHLLWDDTVQTALEGFPALRTGATRLYSEEVNGSSYDWQRGLDDVLIAMTSERRGGVVWGHAYCNALQASGHLYEWNQGHIHFNSGESWYQPSGWVVRLLGENFQPVVLKTTASGPMVTLAKRTEQGLGNATTPALTATAARSRDGRTLVLKVVNLWGGPVTTRIDLGKGGRVLSAEAITMASPHLKAINTAEKPDAIVPRRAAVAKASGELKYTFEPGSFTVIRFRQGG